jgi:hypothetical protein
LPSSTSQSTPSIARKRYSLPSNILTYVEVNNQFAVKVLLSSEEQ